MGVSAWALEGYIGLTNGYFYNTATGEAWVPHGIAYQTWNRPLGVWQTYEQIDYDLDEMVKMGVNSVRIDIVWQHAEEEGDNIFNWENYDYFIQACEERGIRIFALIGYQWPPNWFPDEWYTMHPPETDAEGIYHPERWQSDIINYEHPEARAQYAEWIATVCERYEDSPAIVGWIIGNEAGYLGLWSGLLDGYDPESEQAFREWCERKYDDIADCNAAWGTDYPSFADIKFVEQYRAYGAEGGEWADMVQFREDSIADFIAISAIAAKNADTNHLISYSTVGMQWGEEDWRYHAEDRGKITAACLATNAPIDFFSVNNYPWSILGHESQQGHWGISYTKKVAKVPVLYSETGFTSSETMWPGMNEYRQGPLVRNSLWESLEAGAIGTHIFSWMDRPYITDREKGFGIVYADRRIKPAFWTSRNAFNLMEQVDIHNLLMNSEDPEPDVAFLWTAANDSQYNRYECEMQQVAGALERLGYEPYFIDLQDLADHAYTNFKAVFLPRNMRVEDEVPGSGKTVLDFLRTEVIDRGVHVVAGADLPGMQDANGKPRTAFEAEVDALFGVDVGNVGGCEMPARTGDYVSYYWNPVELAFTSNAPGRLAGGYTYSPQVWKYSDEVELTDGILWANLDSKRNKGYEDSDTELSEWSSWGDAVVRADWGWAYDGDNMVQMWGNSGMWQDFPVVPFGRYTHGCYLRSNSDDPLTNRACAYVAIEWYDEDDHYLGVSESERLENATPGDAWVRYGVDVTAPSNAWTGRRVIRVGPQNLITNGALSGDADAPTGWYAWNTDSHQPEYNVKLGATGNAWDFWYDGGIWQDVTEGFGTDDVLTFGGHLYTPSSDALRNGSKCGAIDLEFYDAADALLGSCTASPVIDAGSEASVWHDVQGTITVPSNTVKARILVRCNNGGSGDGRFFADEIYLCNTNTPSGSVFVDHRARSPGVVVKDHGTAKAALFMYSVGDNCVDGDYDGEMDILPWEWRYDVFEALMSDYFGLESSVQVLGTNDYLCLAEYRTCEDGSTLWQVKNYMYDRFQQASPEDPIGGGDPMTFTIQSEMFEGKTIEAFEQARVIEENCDGQIVLTLDPDGHEMLHVYDSGGAGSEYEAGSSEDRVWHGQNNRSGMMDGGPTNFPLTEEWHALTGYNPVVAGDRIYGIYSGSLFCLDVLTGERIWGVACGQTLNKRSLAVVDGIVYVSSKVTSGNCGHLFARDAATGDELWSFEMELYSATPPVVEDGKVYFGGVGSKVRALDAVTGGVIWESADALGADAYGGITLADGRLYLLDGGVLHCLDAGDGTLLWEISVPRPWYAESTPVVVDGRVYVAMNHTANGVYVYDADTGAYLWKYNAPCSLGKYNSPCVADDRLFMAYSTNVYCYDATQSGTPLWVFNMEGYGNTPAYADGKVYINSSHCYVIDAVNGTQVWSRAISYGDYDPYVRNGWVFFNADGYRGIWSYAYSDGSEWPESGEVISSNQVCRIMDAPALVHPFGDKCYPVQVAYDCRNREDLILKMAFMEAGDNGDGITNECYELLETAVSMNGQEEFWAWIPDADHGDSDYISTPDGGQYQFAAWLESTGGVKVVEAVPQPAMLKWGVRPTAPLPSDLQKDQQVSMDIEWEDLYEYLPWEVTPMTRNDAFPNRVAVFRSGKTEAQFPGHYDTINAVCDWLESMGYAQGNPLDISFDNVEVWSHNGLNAVTYEAENMPVKTTGGGGDGMWCIWSEGYIEDTHDFAEEQCEFTVRAYGSEAGDAWPIMELRIDQVPVAQWTVDAAEYRDYTAVVDVETGEHDVAIAFLNDCCDPPDDRNLYVDKVILRDDQPLFAEDFSNGCNAWSLDAGCANWDIDAEALRATRIGNSDNIFSAGDPVWSNYMVSADIMYNEQGPYKNDAEVYVCYQDRDNYVKVGIRNFFGFYRLKYTVRVDTNYVDQGWIHSFTKANRPMEGEVHNLGVEVMDDTFTVFFDGAEVGSFVNADFTSGKVALGSMAQQLGNWDPAKGYYFIDDDEYSYYSPNEGEIVTLGEPLNLDWGYLGSFFPTLILPGTYVMSDIEVSNVCQWINGGLRCLIATDGGVAMKDASGADGTGRIEELFGVADYVDTVNGITAVQIDDAAHYVTHDYSSGDVISATGDAVVWPLVDDGIALAVAGNAADSAPALIVNTLTNDPISPKKVCCFNFPVEQAGQLTNDFSLPARRAFEWAQGEAHKVMVALNYQVDPEDPDADIVLLSAEGWMLTGSGTNTLILDIPQDGIMTGSNLYWTIQAFPWDADDPWVDHTGFYSSLNDSDSSYVSLDGKGLQILGATDRAYAGRDWDMWAAYNTRGEEVTVSFGIKDVGTLETEDSFQDGVLDDWTVDPTPNDQWSEENGVLRCEASSAGGWSTLKRDNLDVADENITIEYDVKHGDDAEQFGLVYRGYFLNIDGTGYWWHDGEAGDGGFSGRVTNEDGSVSYVVTGSMGLYIGPPGISDSEWHHVVVNIHSGKADRVSDIYIDGVAVLLGVPLPGTNYTDTTVGFYSPYTNGYVEIDDFRVADEQYAFATEDICGESVPTNQYEPTFWPFIPDYDPDWAAHAGTGAGADYEWYAYLRGNDIHDSMGVDVYFAPRLMIEEAGFPTNMEAGDTVSVPIEWENLDQLPMKMRVALQDTRTGGFYVQSECTIETSSGNGNFVVTIPNDVPDGDDYAWAAYIYPTNAADPWMERLGFDDTYRSDKNEVPIEPEIEVVIEGSNGVYTAYSDSPPPAGAEYYTWKGSHDGAYTGVAAPEGNASWLAQCTDDYAGWGVFYPSRTIDLGAFDALRFWVRAAEPLKVQVEAPQGTKYTIYLDEDYWDPEQYDTWQEVVIPKTDFGFRSWEPMETYGPFMATIKPPSRNAMDFIDADTGWVVGSAPYGIGYIRKTVDGGNTWVLQNPGTNCALYGAAFVNAQTGCVCGYHVILRTADGGSTWTTVVEDTVTYEDIFFLNSQTGWACGTSGEILKTVDGGVSWTPQNSGTTAYLYSIVFVDASTGWVCGDSGTILKTVDGGASWSPQSSGTSYSLRDLFFLDANNGWAVGYYGTVRKTVDGGVSWTTVSISVGSCHLYAVKWTDAQHGWIVGGSEMGYFDDATVSLTTDGGSNWVNWGNTIRAVLYDVDFLDQNTGYVAGDHGALYKTVNGGDTGDWTDMFPESKEFLVDHVRWTQEP
jgi:outer membrane protein assembly factor BamB/photosystem II stability/assembly factor-like uncharacterized protein